MKSKLKIVYEDEELLVCDKPSGLPVQSRKVGSMDLESLVKRELWMRTGNANVFVSAVHRLDQPVEGIVLFAKSKKAMAHLSEQMRNHNIEKYYLTVVEGAFEKQEEILTDFLKKDGRQNRSIVVSHADQEGKKAQLKYKVLETGQSDQLLEIQLFTGRHHQIRVQLSHAGHPIVEDACYNPDYQNKSVKVQPALCAYRLSIIHPVRKERLHFTKKPEGRVFQKFSKRIEAL